MSQQFKVMTEDGNKIGEYDTYAKAIDIGIESGDSFRLKGKGKSELITEIDDYRKIKRKMDWFDKNKYRMFSG